jgi:hypothetical protein
MSVPIQRRQFLTLSALSIGAAQFPLSVYSEIQAKRVRLHCAAPSGYAYGHDTERVQGRLVSDTADEDQVVQNLDNIRMVHTPAFEPLPGQGIAPPASNSTFGTDRTRPYTRPVNGVQQATLPAIHLTGDPASVPQLVRRKTFAPLALTLDVAFVRLDQVALAVYETGLIQCSGRIAHSGGQFQELQGAKVTLQVKAYGQAKKPAFTPLSGPILASWEYTRWVSSKASPEEISLVNIEYCRNIRLKYDEITQMTVNLVYWRSR